MRWRSKISRKQADLRAFGNKNNDTNTNNRQRARSGIVDEWTNGRTGRIQHKRLQD